MTELKPCPFCGRSALRKSKEFKIIDGKLEPIIVCVQCTECGCNGPTFGYQDNTVKAWNERI